jgi:hypothetical protein
VLTGTGLTAGINAILIDGDNDVMAYTGARGDQSSFVDYRQIVNSPSNWIVEDGTNDQSANGFAPDVPFDTTSFSVVPEPSLTITLFGFLCSSFILARRRSI